KTSPRLYFALERPPAATGAPPDVLDRTGTTAGRAFAGLPRQFRGPAMVSLRLSPLCPASRCPPNEGQKRFTRLSHRCQASQQNKESRPGLARGTGPMGKVPGPACSAYSMILVT